MPREKPTEIIDVLGTLDLEPHKVVGKYLASKENNKYFLKPPLVDTPGDDVDTFYIQNRLNHDKMMELLKELQESRKLQSKIYAHRVHKMQKSHLKLRMKFVKVNGFLRDFDEKKKTAYKKINDEIEKQKELTENIAVKRGLIDELAIFREEIRATCEEYKPYEKVLEDVVKKSERFSNIQELIDHCDAILFAQCEIERMNSEKFQQIEGMHKRIIEIIKQAELIYGGLKNELIEMERSYNKALSECLRWEKVLVNAKTSVVDLNRDKEQARDGLSVLYRLLCKRRGIDAVILRGDVVHELDFIKDEVELLQDVLEEYQRQNFDAKAAIKKKPKC